MIESIAERVLCIIQSRLAGILSADGYWTSAGRNVRRAQRTLDEDDLPALVIWCDGETARGASGNSASMDVELQITIDAHVSADQDCTGKMLERIRADVKRSYEQGGREGFMLSSCNSIYPGMNPEAVREFFRCQVEFGE